MKNVNWLARRRHRCFASPVTSERKKRQYVGQRFDPELVARIKAIAKKQRSSDRAVWEQLAERMNRKSAFGCLAGLAVAMSAAGQAVTNYVQSDPDFRRVDGKLYNRAKSALWGFVDGRVIKVLPDGIIVEMERRLPLGSPYNSADIPGRRLFIRNYPARPPVAEDEYIPAIRVMSIGTVEIGGATLRAYDYGTPNIVAVVRTNAPTPLTPPPRQTRQN